jgi:hypothetical protein
MWQYKNLELFLVSLLYSNLGFPELAIALKGQMLSLQRNASNLVTRVCVFIIKIKIGGKNKIKKTSLSGGECTKYLTINICKN